MSVAALREAQYMYLYQVNWNDALHITGWGEEGRLEYVIIYTHLYQQKYYLNFENK